MPGFPKRPLAPATLLAAGLLLSLPTPAHAVPSFNVDIGAGELLLALLILGLLTLGMPMLIGLLVRWLMLRGKAGPSTGFYRPLAFASVAWLGAGFLARLLTTGLDDNLAGLLVPVGLGLLAAIGGAAGGVRLDQVSAADRAER